MSRGMGATVITLSIMAILLYVIIDVRNELRCEEDCLLNGYLEGTYASKKCVCLKKINDLHIKVLDE